MALSYLQDSKIDGLLSNHQLFSMKQEAEQQPLPNNSTSPAMFSALDAAASAARLSMLSPQQLLVASQAALMATLPSIYNPQHIFRSWAPPAASSPPLPLHHQPVTSSSSIGTRPTTRRSNNSTSTSSNNMNITNNNNNILSGSERSNKKKQIIKKKNEKSKIDTSKSPTDHTTFHSQTASTSPETLMKETKDKVFTCKVCSRSFGYKHVLQNHERTHTGEKPFECPECHKRFTRDHHLKTHLRLHTGEKPYRCTHCDRQFVQVANLRRHLRVHTGERPYKCDLCSSKFSDSNQLKAHMLIHKGEKPFQCPHCNMRFRRRHHLIHHKCGQLIAAQSAEVVESQAEIAKAETDLLTSDMLDEKILSTSTDEEMAESSRPHHNNNEIIVFRPVNYETSSTASTSNSLSLDITRIPSDLPMQTEPEDLSMSTGMNNLLNSCTISDITSTSDAEPMLQENNRTRVLEASRSLFLRPRAKRRNKVNRI